jgi:hypothetical protein
MTEKRMLIVPAELVKKIDDNRGDVSQAEFIDFLISSQFKQEVTEKTEKKETEYATKTEMLSFEQDIKKLLKSFLDFFVSYGLEIGKQSPRAELEELAGKLQGLEKELISESNEGKAKIKWK